MSPGSITIPKTALSEFVLGQRGHVALYGALNLPRLATLACVVPLARGDRVLFVDGANRVDLYAIADAARRFGRNPRDLLANLLVSRAFTCHQLENLVTEKLNEARVRYGAKWIVVSDPLLLLMDHEVPLPEARRIVGRLLATLNRLPGTVLSFAMPHERFGRADLFASFVRGARRAVPVTSRDGTIFVGDRELVFDLGD